MTTDLFKDVGVEVDIINPDNFLKIKETLTRIGIAAPEKHKLYQSCHILHKRDKDGKSRYVIVSFKEMFILDGKNSNIENMDYFRRNSIASLLEEWSLLKILDDIPEDAFAPISSIKIIPFKEKRNWELISKYSIGKKKSK